MDSVRNVCARLWVQENPGGTKDDFETYFNSLTIAEVNEFKKQAAALKKSTVRSLQFLEVGFRAERHLVLESMKGIVVLLEGQAGKHRGNTGRAEMRTRTCRYQPLSVAIGPMGLCRYSPIEIYSYPCTPIAVSELNIEWAIISC